MVNTVWGSANHGDFNPLADHMTKLPKGEQCDFAAFRFSLHLMLCLSDDFTKKLHTKVAQTS